MVGRGARHCGGHQPGGHVAHVAHAVLLCLLAIALGLSLQAGVQHGLADAVDKRGDSLHLGSGDGHLSVLIWMMQLSCQPTCMR